jgi:chromosome segregation ATPase
MYTNPKNGQRLIGGPKSDPAVIAVKRQLAQDVKLKLESQVQERQNVIKELESRIETLEKDLKKSDIKTDEITQKNTDIKWNKDELEKAKSEVASIQEHAKIIEKVGEIADDEQFMALWNEIEADLQTRPNMPKITNLREANAYYRNLTYTPSSKIEEATVVENAADEANNTGAVTQTSEDNLFKDMTNTASELDVDAIKNGGSAGNVGNELNKNPYATDELHTDGTTGSESIPTEDINKALENLFNGRNIDG